jgi:co-chaperonin GroES (HSP10)
MLRLLAFGPRIVVDPDTPESMEQKRMEKVDLVIPDSVKEKYQGWATTGVIVNVAEGDENLLFKTGEKVVFGKYSGQHVMVEGKELIVLEDREVIGKLIGKSREEEERDRQAAHSTVD